LFVLNVPKAQKSSWTHLMVLLRDETQVDAWFSSFGDSANLDARKVHGLRRTYQRLRNHFGSTRWNSKVMWVMWNLLLLYLEILLVSVQDRCMVCAKHTVGSEIILDAPDSTPRWRSSSGCLIQFIWYSANLDAKKVCGLRRTYQRLRNYFGRTRWNSKVKWVNVEPRFGPFGDSVGVVAR
jgi:hypothetical protein